MKIRNLFLIAGLLLSVALIFNSCASKRYTKKAQKFEEAGLYEDAAYYYYEAVKKKNSNVDAKLGLYKNGQFKLDNILTNVRDAYKKADYREVVYQYLKAKDYYDKLSAVGVNLEFPESYKDYYSEAKSDYLGRRYAEGVEKLNRDEFEAAQKIFSEIMKVDAGFKDVKEKYKIARYEPVYRSANRYLENGMYRHAYYAFDEVLSGTGGAYKQALSLKNEAKKAATITILVTDFRYSQSPYRQYASQLTSEVKSKLLQLNNPFIKLVSAESAGQKIYKNGKIDLKAANLAGIKAVLTGKVLNVTRKQGKPTAKTEQAFIKEVKKTTDKEGNTITKVDYKKTQYTRYTGESSAEIKAEFQLVSTADNEIIVSDMISVSKKDKVDYAKYKGDINKLVPGYRKSSGQNIVKDNYYDVSHLHSLFKARQTLKPVSELLEELERQAAGKIVNKIDNYNPE